ncbi:MAG TPA: hypothetical protein VMC83_09675, partial [Streptosporangiaceae bacterium]|nr:hypothetical protein [Streptosporangiaceae bacterium]
MAAATVLACSTFALIGAAASGPAAAGTGTGSTACPWVGSRAPASVRAAEVLAKMTLDDKLAMVDGTGYQSGTAGYVGRIAANPRLCIPGLNLEDGPQGVADGVTGVTQL